MKSILITGGPTNEAIDKVMTITNMSTGSLSCGLAAAALRAGDRVTLVLHKSVLRSALFSELGLGKDGNARVIAVDSCADMQEALAGEAGKAYDVVIHAAAVGDYRPQFTFRMEDMARELAGRIKSAAQGKELSGEELERLILGAMTDPECKLRDDSKISSSEPHLTTKLTLTTKIISKLREWFPGALLIGCKLLENVPREELIEVAHRLCVKNGMDFIMANDLAELNRGGSSRYLVGRDGFTGIVLNAEGGPALEEYAAREWF